MSGQRTAHPTPRAALRRGVGVILLASFLFGAMAVCVRLATRFMPSSQVAFFRFLGSLVLLLAAAGPHRLRPQPGSLPGLLLRGFLGAAAIVLYYFGIENAGAGFATLLHCTYPVWATLFAGLFLGESLGGRSLVALAVDLAGIVVVVGPGADISAATELGALAALGASVLAGGAVATARHLRLTENALLITVYFMAVGVVLTAPALLEGLPPLSGALLLVLAGVVLTSAGGQWLLHHGLGYTSTAVGSLAAATTVVSAAGLEALFLGEHLGLHTLVGASLMIAAIALAVSRGAAPVAMERSIEEGVTDARMPS